jgi:hypothetical protein
MHCQAWDGWNERGERKVTNRLSALWVYGRSLTTPCTSTSHASHQPHHPRSPGHAESERHECHSDACACLGGVGDVTVCVPCVTVRVCGGRVWVTVGARPP